MQKLAPMYIEKNKKQFTHIEKIAKERDVLKGQENGSGIISKLRKNTNKLFSRYNWKTNAAHQLSTMNSAT